MKFHAPSIPVNLPRNRIIASNFYLKHYGYADYADAVKKYKFYTENDKTKDTKMIGSSSYKHLVDEEKLELMIGSKTGVNTKNFLYV